MAENSEPKAPNKKRLPKFTRQPKAVADKNLTARSFEIIAAIARYRFLPTSLLVRLIEGNEDVTHRHLQLLFHKTLVNRFAFPKTGGSHEFNYYLDNPKALLLLVEHGYAEKNDLDFEVVKGNKEKGYHKITAGDESGGRGLFLHHELMISRFHFMLEVACQNSKGQVELLIWKQGAELHDSVVDSETGEFLPHRPDAFFTLRFPNDPDGRNKSNFFYEADRKTATTTKMLVKFRAHMEFIGQRKHQEKYGIRRVRSVLVETLDAKWAEEMRQATQEICPHSLFWFTTSEIFLGRRFSQKADQENRSAAFLRELGLVMKRIWVRTGQETPVGLFD